MKREKDRITLTLKEADEIREYLEILYAMEGSTLDEDFNAECHRAGFFARKMCELLHGHIDILNGKLRGLQNLNMTRQYDINPQDQEKAENFFRGISYGSIYSKTA